MSLGSAWAVHSSQGSVRLMPRIELDPLGELSMDQPLFTYTPKCSTLGCGREGMFKVAAPWSYGNISELKSYGVCCEEHRSTLFARAKAENAGLPPADGEKFGPVSVYSIRPGARDSELSRLE